MALLSAQGVADFTPVAKDEPQRPIALVVGNSDYHHHEVDPSGSNDAEAVAAALSNLGFHVVKGINLTRADFISRVASFHSLSNGRSAALFYFSGHSASGNVFLSSRVIDGLYPVDSPYGRQALTFGLDLKDILAGMQGDVNLLIVDAPLGDGVRLERPNTLIAYGGNSPKDVWEGEKAMGAFTMALLDALVLGAEFVAVVQEAIRNASLVGVHQTILSIPAELREQIFSGAAIAEVEQEVVRLLPTKAEQLATLPWMESSLRTPYHVSRWDLSEAAVAPPDQGVVSAVPEDG